MTDGHTPKFVRQFADVGEQMKRAFSEYDEAVKGGIFPTEEHAFVKSDCSPEFYEKLERETGEGRQ